MNETINKLNDLREHLLRRNEALHQLLRDIEDELPEHPDESLTYETLLDLYIMRENELRVNEKLLSDLGRTYPCEYCKLDPNQRLCDFCPRP